MAKGRPRARALAPLLFLSLGATLLGLVAWRESARARATAELLTRDYASFIAETFSRHAADRFGFASHAMEAPQPLPQHPRTVLLRLAQADELEPPEWPTVRYYFLYDATSGRLDVAGDGPREAERAELQKMLEGFEPACGANQTVPFGQLQHLGRLSYEPALAVSGWLQTGADGSVKRIAGARFDEDAFVARWLEPLIENETCECPTLLLPESLSSVASNSKAAYFVLRDGAGSVRYESRTAYESSGAARRELPAALPLAGWSLEVSVNPDVVDALLPYGGRDVPWLAFTLLFSLVAVSSVFAVSSFRRSAALVRSQEDFVSNVSHELRTPLTRIRLFNEILLASKDRDAERTGDKATHYRRVIDRECRRLDHLIANVLDFSQLRRATRSFHMEPLDLKEVVDASLELFRSASYDENFRLREHLDDVPIVSGDRAALQQVLVNLLDNAVKYSPDESPVDVSLTRQNGSVAIVVSDQGPGVPPEAHRKIFDAFYRLETGEAQRVAGNGLGLALVRETVEAHGGRVRVEANPGAGSSFVVEIPVS